jgi:hypothetical protein
VKSGDIKGAINEAAPDKLKPLHVAEVYFHFCPNTSMHLISLLLVMHSIVSFNHTTVLEQFIFVGESSEDARTSTANNAMLGL